MLRALKILLGLVVVLVIAATALLWAGPIHDVRIVLNALFGVNREASAEEMASRIRVPEGFFYSEFAKVPHVRWLVVTYSNDVIVSQPRDGSVTLLQRDANGDGRSDGQRVLLRGLARPHGLALHQGFLYVAESGAVGRVGFNAADGTTRGEYQHIITDLPEGGNHWSKTIAFGPDNKLYVSIGSTCNVCEETDTRRATIMQFDDDGKNGRIYASGLRNSVGLAWAPWDNALYATDNGRDLLGDDFPPCELNRIEDGGFYGWPYFNGVNVSDPDVGAKAPANLQPRAPAFGFRAHNAPLGLTFVDGSGLPAQYQRAALVALHGSWNRSQPDGYKVVLLGFAQDGMVSSQDFMTGFENAGDIIGRPVDIKQGADHCFYISDDFAGSVYRVCSAAPAAR